MATSYGGNGKLGTNMQQWEKQGNQRFIIRKIETVDDNVFRPTMIHANEDAEDVFTGFKMLEEYLHHRNGPSKHGSYFPYQLPSQDSGKVITGIEMVEKCFDQPSTVVDKHPVLYTSKSGEMEDLHKIGWKSHSNDTSDDDDDNDDDSHDGSNDDDEEDDGSSEENDIDDDSHDGSNDDDEDDDDDDGSSEENDTSEDDGVSRRKNCAARCGFYNANGFNPGKSKKRGLLGIKYYVLGFNRRKQGY